MKAKFWRVPHMVQLMVRRIAWRLLGAENMPTDINNGDWVIHPGWKHGEVQVVDCNWSLKSVALRLGEGGGIVVWPMRKGMRKIHSA